MKNHFAPAAKALAAFIAIEPAVRLSNPGVAAATVAPDNTVAAVGGRARDVIARDVQRLVQQSLLPLFNGFKHLFFVR